MTDAQVPAALGGMFRHLNVISLRGNEISALPDSIAALRHLEDLCLMQCRWACS
jgi:hypothetical protein